MIRIWVPTKINDREDDPRCGKPWGWPAFPHQIMHEQDQIDRYKLFFIDPMLRPPRSLPKNRR